MSENEIQVEDLNEHDLSAEAALANADEEDDDDEDADAEPITAQKVNNYLHKEFNCNLWRFVYRFWKYWRQPGQTKFVHRNYCSIRQICLSWCYLKWHTWRNKWRISTRTTFAL